MSKPSHAETMANHLAILQAGHGAEFCRDESKHTRTPLGYTERALWAEKKLKTHTQSRCPTCGFWAIWKPKKAGGK